jgi:hypothetical protein
MGILLGIGQITRLKARKAKSLSVIKALYDFDNMDAASNAKVPFLYHFISNQYLAVIKQDRVRLFYILYASQPNNTILFSYAKPCRQLTADRALANKINEFNNMSYRPKRREVGRSG